MKPRRAILCGLLLAAPWLGAVDLDRDGLEDDFEQELLERFRPGFVISDKDCDGRPASFRPGRRDPQVLARDGTIYGQAFPLPGGFVELHYFHLWANDCGRSSHPLDIEHVAVRLESGPSGWRATHWFAAAHQDTPCDLGQAALATVLKATEHGINVFVSHGKHASFLSQESCGKGCGSDRCKEPMRPLARGALINLGEWGAPLNGATWTASERWAFAPKLRTDFDESVLRQVHEGKREIVYLKPGLAPARATVRGLNEGADGLALADEKTTGAVAKAEDHTGRALGTSYEKTKGALKKATGATGGFLGIGKKSQSQPVTPAK